MSQRTLAPATRWPISRANASGSRMGVITGTITEPNTAERLVRSEYAGFRLAGGGAARCCADEIVLNATEPAANVFAKVTGSWRLHVATAARDVDWLTFSLAPLLGAPGQGAYAPPTRAIGSQLGPVGRRWTRSSYRGGMINADGECAMQACTHRRSRAHR